LVSALDGRGRQYVHSGNARHHKQAESLICVAGKDNPMILAIAVLVTLILMPKAEEYL
jgi:hypothetical protein